MPITGSHPEKGIRIELSLGKDAANRDCYSGHIVTPEDEFPFAAAISESGDVIVTSAAPADLSEKTRLIVRTAVRHATAEKSPLPRLIMRWRGEK